MHFYTYNDSKLGSFGLIWKEVEGKIKIIKIFLPTDKNILISGIKEECPSAIKSNSLNQFSTDIKKFISGEVIKFDLRLLDLDICNDFQKKVLIAEYNIPRGFVSTYSRIANKVGTPRGARAVGNALAKNPFPLVIPCHRAIKSDGTIGGFQGGSQMKKCLLEGEGVIFSEDGSVAKDRIYY